MIYPYTVWNNNLSLKEYGANLTLSGYSVSAVCSSFYIREWKVLLDTGISIDFQPKHIFITHTHGDHIDKLGLVLTDLKDPPCLYVPKGAKEFIKDYLDSFHKMTYLNKDIEYIYKYKLIEVDDGDEINIKVNNKDLSIKVFKTDHSIKSIGFAFSECRKKLKKEYSNYSSSQIKDLKKQNIQITESVKVPMIIYTGDTRNSIFTDEVINFYDYKIIITECTFIDSLMKDIDAKLMAHEKYHNCFSNLIDIANNAKYKNTTFLLCHYSARHNQDDINKYYEKVKITNPNIIFWNNVPN